MTDRTCTAPECDKPLRTKTFCAMHAYRMKRHGSLDRPSGRAPVAGLFCTLGDCDRPRYNSRGWCKRHYDRWLTHGDPSRVDLILPTDGSFGISAAHKRIVASRGRAAERSCEMCGSPAQHWAYDHAAPDEQVDPRGYPFSGDPMHYMSLCVPCHKNFDLSRESRAEPARSGLHREARG